MMIIRNNKTKNPATDLDFVFHIKGNVTWIDDIAARQTSRHFIVFPHQPLSREAMSLPLRRLSRELSPTAPVPKKPK